MQSERKGKKVLRDRNAEIEQRTNDILFNVVELTNFRHNELIKMPVWEFFAVVKRTDNKQKAIKKKLKQSQNGRRNRH